MGGDQGLAGDAGGPARGAASAGGSSPGGYPSAPASSAPSSAGRRLVRSGRSSGGGSLLELGACASGSASSASRLGHGLGQLRLGQLILGLRMAAAGLGQSGSASRPRRAHPGRLILGTARPPRLVSASSSAVSRRPARARPVHPRELVLSPLGLGQLVLDRPCAASSGSATSGSACSGSARSAQLRLGHLRLGRLMLSHSSAAQARPRASSGSAWPTRLASSGRLVREAGSSWVSLHGRLRGSARPRPGPLLGHLGRVQADEESGLPGDAWRRHRARAGQPAAERRRPSPSQHPSRAPARPRRRPGGRASRWLLPVPTCWPTDHRPGGRRGRSRIRPARPASAVSARPATPLSPGPIRRRRDRICPPAGTGLPAAGTGCRRCRRSRRHPGLAGPPTSPKTGGPGPVARE